MDDARPPRDPFRHARIRVRVKRDDPRRRREAGPKPELYETLKDPPA